MTVRERLAEAARLETARIYGVTLRGHALAAELSVNEQDRQIDERRAAVIQLRGRRTA